MKARTVPQICRAARISERMFYVAQEVRDNGIADLLAWVLRGDLSMHLAAQICRFPHEMQREILAEFPRLTSRERTRMLRLLIESAAPA